MNNIRAICSNPYLLAKNPEKDFTRNRKISGSTLIHYLLSQHGNSLNTELRDYFSINEKDIPTKQALIHQRHKLNEEALPTLFYMFNRDTEQVYDSRTYDGYHLYAFDGTTLTIATNPDSETYLPKQNYNQLLITACYDLLNCTYKDLDIRARAKQYEVQSAIHMLNRNNFPEKSIFIGDRLYGSLNLLEHIKRSGKYFLIRVKDRFIKELHNLPMAEFDIDIFKELRTSQTNKDKELYRQGKAHYISGKSSKGKQKIAERWDFESPYTMNLRVVRVKLEDDNYETIITNLDRFTFTPEKIKELYHLRWGIETSFRDLKYNIGLLHLHAKTEEFVFQEIYSSFVMFNACQRAICSTVVKQNPKGKHEVSLNVTQAINVFRDRFRKLDDNMEGIAEQFNRYLEIVRPGRKDKRKQMKPKEFVGFIYRVA